MVKNPPAMAGDSGLISGLGRSPGGGNGNPLQSSCLENSMDRGAGWATVYGVAELDTSERAQTPVTQPRTNWRMQGLGTWVSNRNSPTLRRDWKDM